MARRLNQIPKIIQTKVRMIIIILLKVMISKVKESNKTMEKTRLKIKVNGRSKRRNH